MNRNAIVIGLLAVMTVGCGSLDKILYDVEDVRTTNRVMVADGIAQDVITLEPRYVVKPAVRKTLDAVGSLIPIPGGDMVLGLGGAILAAVAGWRNRKNKGRARQVQGALIDSVQAARRVVKALPNGESIDNKIVETIKDLQAATGTREEIHEAVKSRGV